MADPQEFLAVLANLATNRLSSQAIAAVTEALPQLPAFAAVRRLLWRLGARPAR